MTCYKINCSKLRKKGEEGYEKGQEQAKEYFAEIPPNGSCYINVTEEDIIKEICSMAGIEPPTYNLLSISIDREENEEDFGLKIYSIDSEGEATYNTIAYKNIPSRSNYELANEILNFILSKWEG